jgi:hypothetical protein
MRQCKKPSQHNTLDQHFAAKSQKSARNAESRRSKTKKKAANLRAQRAQVNVRADAAKSEVTLGDHFRLLDRRIDTMRVDMSFMQASRLEAAKLKAEYYGIDQQY